MNKLACLLCILNAGFVFAQRESWNGIQFTVSPEYEVMHDCSAYVIDDLFWCTYTATDVVIPGGTCYTENDYKYISGVGTLVLHSGYRIDTPAYKIKDNASFPEDVIYSNVHNSTCSRWVPLWYFEALEQKNRNVIIDAEPAKRFWDADIAPGPWYRDIPEISSIVLTNTGMAFYTSFERVSQMAFLFENLKEIEPHVYEAAAYSNKWFSDKDIIWLPNRENFPDFEDGSMVTFRFEINGKEMKVYNGETGALCFDLIQVSGAWAELYEQFVETNKVPEGLSLPAEYVKRRQAVGAEYRRDEQTHITVGSKMRVWDNLRLRTEGNMDSDTITTMAVGTRLKILEVGKKDTIDGITSNWVKVCIADGWDIQDKGLSLDLTGWCFGGYLEEDPYLYYYDGWYSVYGRWYQCVTGKVTLYSDASQNAAVVVVLRRGTWIREREEGREETISGVRVKWVRVEVRYDSWDQDGGVIPEGTSGWCFDSYVGYAGDIGVCPLKEIY